LAVRGKKSEDRTQENKTAKDAAIFKGKEPLRSTLTNKDMRPDVVELVSYFCSYHDVLLESEEYKNSPHPADKEASPRLPDKETMEKLKKTLGRILDRFASQPPSSFEMFLESRGMNPGSVSTGLKMAIELIEAYNKFSEDWPKMEEMLKKVDLDSAIFLDRYGAEKIAYALALLSKHDMI